MSPGVWALVPRMGRRMSAAAGAAHARVAPQTTRTKTQHRTRVRTHALRTALTTRRRPARARNRATLPKAQARPAHLEGQRGLVGLELAALARLLHLLLLSCQQGRGVPGQGGSRAVGLRAPVARAPEAVAAQARGGVARALGHGERARRAPRAASHAVRRSRRARAGRRAGAHGAPCARAPSPTSARCRLPSCADAQRLRLRGRCRVGQSRARVLASRGGAGGAQAAGAAFGARPAARGRRSPPPAALGPAGHATGGPDQPTRAPPGRQAALVERMLGWRAGPPPHLKRWLSSTRDRSRLCAIDSAARSGCAWLRLLARRVLVPWRGGYSSPPAHEEVGRVPLAS
jgi:hypothetical protein